MKVFVITLLMVLITGCSTINNVFPDRSREYERAETMPSLEIPPDLVASGINDSMSIPGEAARVVPSQGQATTPSTPVSTTVSRQASIESINNKPLLSIPEEYTTAWAEVDKILQNAEIQINEQDQTTGVVNVSYSIDGQSEDRGLFTMIRTWDWRTSGDAQDFQISLTGVGNKTELIILDMEGEWVNDDASNSLLTTIRDHYNLSQSQ